MKNLDRYLEDTYFYQDLPGLAVSVKAGDLIYRRAFGYSDFPAKKPMELTDVFHCASVAKLFTSTAAMQLSESGKIDINSRVADIISGFKINDERSEKITVKDLMQHTSGIGMVYDLHWDRPETSETALKEYALSDEIMKRTLLSAPPENRFCYSDAGYDILGAVISEIAGMSFEQYIDENIFAPAEMKSSSFLTFARGDKDMLVRPHTKDISKHIVYEKYYPYNRIHAPSSTLTSNVYDLEKFARLHIDGSLGKAKKPLLAQETYRYIWQPKVKTLNKNEYMGTGWFIYERNGYTYYGHNGGDDGFSSAFWICPEADFYLIALTNTRQAEMKKICRQIFDILLKAKD